MKKYFLVSFIFFLVIFNSCSHSVVKPLPKVNSEKALTAPYVLLISIDGYRYDYTKIFSPPHIKDFFKEGSSAKSLIPSFPSKTFPNHYTMVTGLYPENHGIVANTFYDFKRASGDDTYKLSLKSAVTDGSWYSGIPIWVAAEQQGMISGTYFWPGSEAVISQSTPTYLKAYDGKIPNDERVNTVLSWLNYSQDIRPHFLTLYFSDVDSAGHTFGTTSKEVRQAVLDVDESLGKLFEGLKKLPFLVNVILVSDHGMQDLDENKVFYLDDYTDLRELTLGDPGPLLSIYSPQNDYELLEKTYKNLLEKSKGKKFAVYRRHEVPSSYHFSKNPRIGDLVVIAEAPYSLGLHDSRFKMIKGSHGYEAKKFPTMQGIFYAKGPTIKEGKILPSFENIHLYPFILKILGLELRTKIDGKFSVLDSLFKKD